MALAGSTGLILHVNRALADLLGYCCDELVGTNLYALGHPEDLPDCQTLVKRFLDGLGGQEFERRFLTKKGRVVWALLTLAQVRDPDHIAVHLVVQLQDITKRRQQEEELRRRTAFIEALLESTIDGVLVVDANNQRVLQNQRLIDMFRIPEKILSAKNEEALIQYCAEKMKNPEQFLEEVGDLYNRQDLTQQDEVEFKDGTVVDRYSAKVITKDGRYYGRISTFRDITERRRTEDALRLLSSAVEQSPVSVCITNPQGEIVYVNRKFTQCTGYSFEEVLGRNPRILKSGLSAAEEYKNLWDTITRGAEWRGEFRNRRKNGELYWASGIITPLRDAHGNITHFMAIKEDTTERKMLDSQLQQARKLEALGQLSAGIAHEINTPMQFVGDNVSFLKKSAADLARVLSAVRQALKDDASGRSFEQLALCCQTVNLQYLEKQLPRAIDQCLDGIQRVKAIVCAMKEFSHPGGIGKSLVDVNKAIETTITVARNEWKYVAEVETQFADLPPVHCHGVHLNQVILNLLVNAVDAIRDTIPEGSGAKGKITITTNRQSDWVQISIRDTGTGIPDQVQPRIFDYFFTTKPVGKGTGQGLALAHNTVVKEHGGRIWFETAAGKGTTFHIRLPLAAADQATEQN